MILERIIQQKKSIIYLNLLKVTSKIYYQNLIFEEDFPKKRQKIALKTKENKTSRPKYTKILLVFQDLEYPSRE
jgi:hypothetical protein